MSRLKIDCTTSHTLGNNDTDCSRSRQFWTIFKQSIRVNSRYTLTYFGGEMSREEDSNLTITCEKSSSVNTINPPKLFWSARLSLTLVCFFCIIFENFMRFSFSTSIVCMTSNNTESGIEAEFNWDKNTRQLLLSAHFYGYISTLLIGGFLATKIGHKRPLSFAMGATSILVALMPILARWVTNTPNILLEINAPHRLHWGALFAARVLMGSAAGFITPTIYSVYGYWTWPEEKAILLAIVFSANSLASIVTHPIASLLCFTGIDGGWPLIFYSGAGCGVLWWILHFFFTYDYPENHPRISSQEKDYLASHCCAKAGAVVQIEGKVPWLEALKSVSVHALWITHFSANWAFYTISLNMPIFVNEAYDFGIVVVSP